MFVDTTVPSFLIEIREPGDHQLASETGRRSLFLASIFLDGPPTESADRLAFGG
jgi:hypothetical protein